MLPSSSHSSRLASVKPLWSCFLVVLIDPFTSSGHFFSNGPSTRASGSRNLRISKDVCWSKTVGIWLTTSLGLYRGHQDEPCQEARWGEKMGDRLLWLLPWPVSPVQDCSDSKCWLCWSWRKQWGKCYGEWLIEIQSTLQNDLFDIPSRKLLFVELIIHSCIHEKKYNKCIISA